MGTGDFTIEWFQYQLTSSGANQRIFAIGSYPSTSIGVSQEGSDTSKTFYAWISGANPNISTTSKAAVFCPSIRNGLTELTRETG